MRVLMYIAAVSFALAQTALAQVTFPAQQPPSRTVTILSDGISDPNGAASQVLNEIAVSLDKTGGLRVLSVTGYGGPANARDLLQLHGADLAVVNNDVLAYLDLAKALPEARRKIRLMAPLFHQRAFLFARQNVKSIEDLRDRKIGVPASRPSRGVTARTIFGVLKIKVELLELSDNELSKKAADLDAVLLFEKDLSDLKALGITPAAYHLVPIPAGGPLSRIYLPAKPIPIPLPGFSSGLLETVKVSTLLASYDWSPAQGRYADVADFTAKFFAQLAKIRESNPRSPFANTDVKVEIPGWQRFGPAVAVAAAAPGVAVQDEVLQIPASPAPLASKEALKILAVSHPPVTNNLQDDGGVALKLVTGALEAGGTEVSVQWVDDEKALLDGLFDAKAGDAGLFWQTLNCEAPHDQSASEAAVCDTAAFSDPVMQAVVGVFTRIDTPLNTAAGQETPSRTLCAPEGQPIFRDRLTSIPWLEGAKVKTMRLKTVIDCIAAVDSHDADAFISIEPEGRFAIEKLKLTQTLQLSQRLGVPAGLHVLVAKDNPRQAHIVQTINDALAKFKASANYAAVISAHLGDLTASSAKMP